MSPRLALAALLLLAAGATGCAADGAADARLELPGPSPVGDSADPPLGERLVLVSGRDDHGMVALRQVPVFDEVDGAHAVGRIPDGTLARVLDTDGQWLKIATAEGRPAVGWLDGFYLRGESRLVGPPPSCSVSLGRPGRGQRREGGTLVELLEIDGDRVLVHALTPPATRAWVARGLVQELPPQGSRCVDTPEQHEDEHAH